MDLPGRVEDHHVPLHEPLQRRAVGNQRRPPVARERGHDPSSQLELVVGHGVQAFREPTRSPCSIAATARR